MLRFVWEKISNKKWLIISLLVGNLLLVAIAAASPMYTKAALHRMLSRSMSDYAAEHEHYPTTVSVYSAAQFGHEQLDEDIRTVESLSDTLGVDPFLVVRHCQIKLKDAFPEQARPGTNRLAVRLSAMRDMDQHIEIVSGRMYSAQPDEEGVIDVLISEKCMVSLGVMQGEILTMPELAEEEGGEPVRVRIAGIFRAGADDRLYWYHLPSHYDDQFFVREELFDKIVPAKIMEKEENINWYWIFDHRLLTVDNCSAVARASIAAARAFDGNSYRTYRDEFSELIQAYEVSAAQVRGTLRILQVPIYVLLMAFIFMVSRQMLEIESAEIAVIKSRGASRRQILGVYSLQSGLLAAAGLVLGIPLAMLVCQIIGSSNAFLEFVSRRSLQLEITWEVLLYALAAALVGMAAMVLPVLRHSKTTIVAAKQSKSRRSTPLWQKLFLDVILIAVSLYELYSFQGQKEFITSKVQSGAGLDPLIYLASSMFIVGCGLLALRLIPLFVRLVYRIGRRWWNPSLYASFLWVQRARGGGYIMVFLVVTIALGIFNASTARTINSNETDRITYSDGGADVVLMEKWKDNSMAVAEDDTGEVTLAYSEPDYGRFAEIPGLVSSTRVFCDDGAKVSIELTKTGDHLTLMGIHTKEFGETAALKEGLMGAHFYEYLNALAGKSDAVLVSSQFRDKYGFSLGDSITYRNKNGQYARGVIYAFVDYWPSYLATTRVRQSDGSYREEENLLIVANLGYLQAQWGVMPYQVWMRMENRDTGPVYDFIEEQGLTLKLFRDQTADLIAMKNDPGIQGTNGILTVGFVVALVLCTVGFLIYWILAIRNRALQFGIFRAMGMSMGEIIVMLLNEQLYVSGLSIAFGVGVGILASWLYVPLIQLAYVKASMPLPLSVSLAGSDVLRLLAVVLAVVAACMVILGTIVRRLKVAQALKLGED